jgi:hypothetical protein
MGTIGRSRQFPPAIKQISIHHLSIVIFHLIRAIRRDDEKRQMSNDGKSWSWVSLE